jgi:hypothetical protein
VTFAAPAAAAAAGYRPGKGCNSERTAEFSFAKTKNTLGISNTFRYAGHRDGPGSYMDEAPAHLRCRDAEAKPEDVARLSPLGHETIKFFGRYSFAWSDSVARGELRPLPNPEGTGGHVGPNSA